MREWAQPVVKRRWVPITIILDAMKRATGYRFFIHSSHRAWELAVGVER